MNISILMLRRIHTQSRVPLVNWFFLFFGGMKAGLILVLLSLLWCTWIMRSICHFLYQDSKSRNYILYRPYVELKTVTKTLS